MLIINLHKKAPLKTIIYIITQSHNNDNNELGILIKFDIVFHT